ncbi:hypothetical protein [Penaeicola halotolerans]|uniref:hypothetical protein n=1 Tax=Penaeicola halotolerans TaxID=2793196 RepID=UPI001CF7FDC8|nr:hypothetical protein [Penaeicola halotolerans]
MTFEVYLQQKKIDSVTFQQREPERWQAFKQVFDQISPESFTQQKLFLINQIRRNYPLVNPV